MGHPQLLTGAYNKSNNQALIRTSGIKNMNLFLLFSSVNALFGSPTFRLVHRFCKPVLLIRQFKPVEMVEQSFRILLTCLKLRWKGLKHKRENHPKNVKITPKNCYLCATFYVNTFFSTIIYVARIWTRWHENGMAQHTNT